MSNAKKGPIRLLSDEVVHVLLPKLHSMDFVENSAFSQQGKWNGNGYIWQYLRQEDKGIFTLVVIVACGKKLEGLIVDAQSFRLDGHKSGIDPLDEGISSSNTPHLQRLLQSPLAILTEVSARPNTELRLLRWFEHMPGGLRKLLIPLKFITIWGFAALNTIATLGLFIFYVPFVGIRNVTSLAPAVVSGQRQKRIVARAAQVLEAMLKDGPLTVLSR